MKIIISLSPVSGKLLRMVISLARIPVSNANFDKFRRNEIRRLPQKKAGNNSKETDHAPNCKFSYVRTSKIVFTTWLVLRTTKCCTHVIVYCIRHREKEGEGVLSGFENYSVAFVSPWGGSLHTQVGKKNHILEPMGCPVYLRVTTKGLPKIISGNEYLASLTFNLSPANIIHVIFFSIIISR